MQKITREKWCELLRPGDIGLSYRKSIGARLQNIFRKKTGESEYLASHSFYCKGNGKISEAQGLRVASKPALEFAKNHDTIWVFRKRALTPSELRTMNAYIAGAEEAGGVYSWAGVLQFIKKYIFGWAMKDKWGVYCAEFTSRAIMRGELPYMSRDPWKVTPSYQLGWMMDTGRKTAWKLSGYAEEGHFYCT